MKSKVTMMMAMVLAMAFCTAMVVMAEDAAPAKPEAKGGCATCPGCGKDKAKGEKEKVSITDRTLKHLEAAKPALTEEQKTKVKELCAAAEKKMAEATDGKVKREAMMELRKGVDGVLTAEQLASMPKRPEGRRHKGEGKEEAKGTEAPPAETK